METALSTQNLLNRPLLHYTHHRCFGFDCFDDFAVSSSINSCKNGTTSSPNRIF